MPQVIIRNPKTDEEYGIDSADFRAGKHYHPIVDGKVQPGQSYADAGFRIVSLADGRPYTGPLNDSADKIEGGVIVNAKLTDHAVTTARIAE